MTGTIETVKHDKGFGFILAEARIFLSPLRGHRRIVRGPEGRRPVEFDVGETPKGPQAERIRKK